MRIRSQDASGVGSLARGGGRRLFLPGAALAVAGASLVLVAARQAARTLATPSPAETQFLTPWELGIPFEDVSFVTGDGLKLSGWWLPNPEARRTVVALSGYDSVRHHILGIGAALWRGGSNVLLFDNRGCGSSEGDGISLGHHERLDATAAVGYSKGRAPDLPLGVVGYSMGGAVALMVAADDARIEAVVVDSPFASQTNVLRVQLRGYVGPLDRPALALASLFLDHEPREVEPVEYVCRISPRPVLLIHGEEDTVTDPDDSRKMFGLAGEPKELWVVPGAGHVGSYYADRKEYCRRVTGFFDRHLRG